MPLVRVRAAAFACLVVAAACDSGRPPPSTDLLGGSLALPTCGVTIRSVDGATAPYLSAPQAGADPTPKQVHLSMTADPARTMSVLWRTNDDDTLVSEVEYGPAGGAQRRVEGVSFAYEADAAPTGKVRIHEAFLCDLQPDTEYTYRVGGKAGGRETWSPTYTFRTAPDRSTSPDAEIVALLIGDTRNDPATWGTAVRKALELAPPELILFNGDAVALGLAQDLWDDWFAAAGDALARAPIAYAHGNHDVNATAFYSQFTFPGDESNYAFDFGPLHVAVANDSPAELTDIGGPVAAALERNLASDAPWKLAMHHKPPFTAAASPRVADVTPVRDAFVPIYDRLHPDLVITGHEHFYQRSKPMRAGRAVATHADGTIYVIAGSAGAPLYEIGTQPWVETIEKTYSFAIARIRRTQLQLTAYRAADGTTLDSLTISK
jgi:hypothetical protein